jgi:RNA polymerase sigma-70 factor (ECF subfamily)
MPEAAPGAFPSIEDTLARARVGDTAAFGELVREYQGMVFSLARHFTRRSDAAEDLAQEVFLELFRSIGRVESGAHLTFWLRRVTSHRCIDQARRQACRQESSFGDVPERPADGPRLPDPFLSAQLRRRVAELPPIPRMVIALRYQEDLDPQEIAAILEMPVNTIKSHMRRAIQRLRAGLPTLKEHR